jgi:hypothetical protein
MMIKRPLTDNPHAYMSMVRLEPLPPRPHPANVQPKTASQGVQAGALPPPQYDKPKVGGNIDTWA